MKRFEEKDPGMLGERLTGFNRNRYIHGKFLLVDPLETVRTLDTGVTRENADPIIVTGSANFSEDSMTDNDENMLVIRGDTRCADIYFGEFMRIFDHIHTRFLLKRSKNEDPGEVR